MFEQVRVGQHSDLTLDIADGRVRCLLQAGAAPAPLFPVAAATRLLMDKKDLTRMRVILESQNKKYIDLQFGSASDRDRFAASIKGASAVSKREVDSNASTKSEVKSEHASATLSRRMQIEIAPQRLFHVIDLIIDSETMKMRPLSEQTIADIFHAAPELAAAHETLAVDPSFSEADFWRHIADKYSCFRATPLDDVLGDLSVTAALNPATNASPLMVINDTSRRALAASRLFSSKRDRSESENDLHPTTTFSNGAPAAQPTVDALCLGAGEILLDCTDALLSRPCRGPRCATPPRPAEVRDPTASRAALANVWQLINASDTAAAARLAERVEPGPQKERALSVIRMMSISGDL